MGKMDFTFTELGKLGESISVQKMEGNGNVYFRVTKLYKDQSGAWKPTNKGVSIPLGQVPSLISYLEKFAKDNESALSECTKTISGSDVFADLD